VHGRYFDGHVADCEARLELVVPNTQGGGLDTIMEEFDTMMEEFDVPLRLRVTPLSTLIQP
jgi:hypothetical protein